MKNNSEFFDGGMYLNDKFGGSVTGETFDGDGDVVLTDFGEFVSKITEQGDLAVSFPRLGLTCIYDDEGHLGLVTLELVSFFAIHFKGKTLTEGEMKVLSLIEILRERQEMLTLTVCPQSGIIEIELVDASGESLELREYNDLDFKRRILGHIEVYDVEMDYQIDCFGDEMRLVAGDADPNDRLYCAVVSERVDFIEDVTSADPLRFQSLAKKVLLN